MEQLSGLFGGATNNNRAHLVPHGRRKRAATPRLYRSREVEYVIQLVAQYKEDIKREKSTSGVSGYLKRIVYEVSSIKTEIKRVHAHRAGRRHRGHGVLATTVVIANQVCQQTGCGQRGPNLRHGKKPFKCTKSSARLAQRQ